MQNSVINPLFPAQNEHFRVGNSDLSHFDNYNNRCECGAVILCRKGRCEVTLDNYHGTLRRNVALLMLPGSLLSLKGRTTDFQADFFSFSRSLFEEAAFRIELDFIRLIKNHPVTILQNDSVRSMNLWLQILDYSYRDHENRFRNTIVKNRLQNALLEMCDKVMRRTDIARLTETASSRQIEIFNRFIQLLHQHGNKEREVTFYAEQLCISSRYLSTITHNIAGRTAKSIIDNEVLLELKLLLQNTDLSIQEIAYRMHFPDQSYLGRFFRKQTGISPTAFRNGMR